MQAIQELLSNRVLISGLVGWGAAQVLKTIIYALMHHTLDLTRISATAACRAAIQLRSAPWRPRREFYMGWVRFHSPSA